MISGKRKESREEKKTQHLEKVEQNIRCVSLPALNCFHPVLFKNA